MRANRTIAAIVIVCCALHGALDAAEKGNTMEQVVRKPAVAGQFYTGDAGALRAEIERFLDQAGEQHVEGDVVAIVSPHAGYVYSGQVAAYGYRLIRGKTYTTVVVIAPSHTEYFDHSSVFDGKSYLTPLGEIPIDHELVELITADRDLVRIDTKGHLFGRMQRGEHALEVQLPFLQVALGEFSLVPIVMGDQSPENVEALGKALGTALRGRNALIVASTDLSHFHGGSSARKLDGVFAEKLREFDPAELSRSLGRRETEACGGGPTAAAMIAARALGADRCVVLHYANSGDVTGDTSNVVGYVSAAMLRPAAHGADSKRGAKSSARDARETERGGAAGGGSPGSALVTGLTDDDKRYLLTLARRVIEAQCNGTALEIEPSPSPVLRERRGGFVTLKKHGQLRGCIGYIEAVRPLVETVKEMAASAAFKDWRFRPVTADELPEIDIEISVLSPITPIDDPASVIVGTHGLIVSRGANRGLLLPQVATEWHWDRETFLDQTCIKAGLPAGAWREPGTTIEVFTAEVFSEIELGLR